MDTREASAKGEDSFLTECVDERMSAQEAAESTRACWTEAEEALTPVIGHDGLVIVFCHGEEVAERLLGVVGPPAARASIDAFCDWMRSLSTEQAVTACKTFLASVQDYLLSLLGTRRLGRLLRRAQAPARRQQNGER